MKLLVKKATTNHTVYVFIQDSSSTTGAGLTGLVYNSAGLVCYYVRPLAAAVALSLATQTVTGAHSDGGFVEVDATNMPGVYRLDLSDAIIATGVDSVVVHLKGATNMAPLPLEIQLTDIDVNVATLTATDIVDEWETQSQADPTGFHVNVKEVNDTAQTANDNGADINTILSRIIGTLASGTHNPATAAQIAVLSDWINDGRLDVILDIIAADVINIDGAAMRGTDGALTDKTGFSLAVTGLDAIPSTATGMVEASKAVWDRVLTGGTHNIPTSAGRRLRGIQDFQGYENGSIWIDTVNGTAGTVDFENGTVENPVLTLADALTLNASLGFNRFTIFNGSTITLASTFNNYLFTGVGWTLALGGQDTGGTHFIGPTASGIATGTETTFVDAHMGNCTIDIMHLESCSLSGTLIVGAAGEQHISNCHSDIAGVGTPIFDTGVAVANSNINFRNYSGGIELQNLGQVGTDTVSIEGDGQVILNANCIGGSINIRGNFELTDNSATTTINDDARYDAPRQVDLTWDEVLTGADHNIADSAGRRLRTNQEFGSYQDDSVWIDTIAGSAGTTDYESGTILNKVDSIADANTIGTSLGISGRAIIPGSSITLAASQENQNFWGNNWTLALGGQSISATHIRGANVSGVCSGASIPEFHECFIGAVTVPPCRFVSSDIEGIITLPVGTVDFHHSAGEAGGVLDYGVVVANTTVNWTDFSGELVVDNLGQSGTDILSIRGHGKVIFNASCIGGTVNWDGHFTITDNGSGITFNSDDISTNVETALAEVAKIPKSDGTVSWNSTALASINAEVDTALSDYGLPTLTELTAAFTEIKGAGWTTTDTLEAIRDYLTTVNTNVDTNETKIDAVQSTVDALNNTSIADILDTPLTESYVAKGAQVSLAQGLYEVLAVLMERANVSTSAGFNKRDGTTPAFTGTMDDAANPTSITRTS